MDRARNSDASPALAPEDGRPLPRVSPSSPARPIRPRFPPGRRAPSAFAGRAAGASRRAASPGRGGTPRGACRRLAAWCPRGLARGPSCTCAARGARLAARGRGLSARAGGPALRRSGSGGGPACGAGPRDRGALGAAPLLEERRGLERGDGLRDLLAARDRFQEPPHDLARAGLRQSEEHTSELQSRLHLVCRLLLEKKKIDLDL